jgi:hypothetical protein
MTHPRNAPPAGAGAEKAAFLRDMRALRDQAGLGPRDLAARAHFPESTLTTAEAGPDLPSLPVLQAYVRGCGAPEAEWEDRWRRLNANDGTDGSEALPTRAPSSSRQPARAMPFPVGGQPDQEAIGYGLARVARGLVPLSPDPADSPPDLPTRTPFGGAAGGNGGMRPSAGFSDFSASGNGNAGNGGWFDPAPKNGQPPASGYTPPPASPPSPASPGAPTEQYPAVSGYQPPDYQTPSGYQAPSEYQSPGYQAPEYQAPERPFESPSTYSSSTPAPSYRLPEEFRTPAPQPPDLPGLAAGGGPVAGGGTGGPAAGRSLPSSPGGSSGARGSSGPGTPSGAPGAPGASAVPGATSAAPKAHAAPATPQRRTSGWVIAAVIIVLIIAAAIWLLLSH